MEKTIHQGRNIKRLREMLGIKLEALAIELGEEWNQRKISILETKEVIDPELLEQVSKALKVPVEAIRNFDAEQVIHNINNVFHDNSVLQNQYISADRIIDLYEQRIIVLYERMLQAEREKNEVLQRVIDHVLPLEKRA